MLHSSFNTDASARGERTEKRLNDVGEIVGSAWGRETRVLYAAEPSSKIYGQFIEVLNSRPFLLIGRMQLTVAHLRMIFLAIAFVRENS